METAEIEERSTLKYYINGRVPEKKLLNTILFLTCDVIKKSRPGAKFDVYGVCTGELEVTPLCFRPDVNCPGMKYLAEGELDYPNGEQTTFQIFLPKQAEEFQPVVEKVEVSSILEVPVNMN